MALCHRVPTCRDFDCCPLVLAPCVSQLGVRAQSAPPNPDYAAAVARPPQDRSRLKNDTSDAIVSWVDGQVQTD
jgi:hypothetical protein